MCILNCYVPKKHSLWETVIVFNYSIIQLFNYYGQDSSFSGVIRSVYRGT